jgi:poly(3-hydroxybutyrate) depolymerase
MITSKETPFGRAYREYSAHADKPILIYLHGAGERGTNPDVIDRVGFVKNFVPANSENFTILAPQQTSNYNGWIGNPFDEKHDDVEFMLWARENYSSDGRLYLTGHSMGGEGVWKTACLYPDIITAFVVSAGGGYNYNLTRNLGAIGLPGRSYHGDKDTSQNSYSRGVQAVNWYKAGGGADILTTYAGAGHGIDSRVYAEADLASWMLSQGTPGTPAPAPEEEIIDNPTIRLNVTTGVLTVNNTHSILLDSL